MDLQFGYGALGSLPKLRGCRMRRASSYDRSGGNRDYVLIGPGQTYRFADLAGAGVIRHLWPVFCFHIQDPIPFQCRILVTCEHGHGNDRADDWSSVAYWYQLEPHAPFPAMRPAAARLPRM